MTLQYVNNQVNQCLKKSLCKNGNGNLINKLHPDIDVRLNSLNVYVGKQGSSKTVSALTQIIKLSELQKDSELFHLVIYVTKDGNNTDVSFNSIKHLINIPIVTVSEEEVESFVKELVAAKSLYYLIKREHLESKINNQQQADMFEVLHINNYHYNFLHTIIMFDDISNSILFSKPETYFSQFVKKLRHYNCIVFMLIQGFKGILPHIKNEISCLYVFSGFNANQLYHIYYQSASNLSYNEFKELYGKLSDIKRFNVDKYPYLLVDVIDGGETTIRQG